MSNEAANPPDPAGDVTRLLRAIREGDAGAESALASSVYAELRRLAGSRMRQEAADKTLQATALVHEAWLRLRRGADSFEDRCHFFGAAARVMRQILVEGYRRRRLGKATMDGESIPAFDVSEIAAEPLIAELDLVALGEALDELEHHDARMAQIVQLRFFAGLSMEDTAATLSLSERTVKREWAVARAWLFRRMS